ncbi:MAG: GntR family transcriptional regulator [Roseiflexaceae bacterium]|nr:GntR family transcriptional regulator [Roseiflexaceae bacterium]
MQQKLPVYQHIQAQLMAKIVGGELAAGDQLPSQRTLCEQYQASHMTVRRAIDDLLAEGVIYAIPGKGLYVAAPKQDAEAHPLVGFSEDMAQRGMHASTRLLAAELVGASTSMAQVLELAVGAPLVSLRRLRSAAGQPMAIQISFLPHARCPGLLDHDLEQHSLFGILRGFYGLQLARSTTAVETALADEQQAALLQLPLPAALLITEQLTVLNDGQPIEFVRSAYRGDRYRLRLEHHTASSPS